MAVESTPRQREAVIFSPLINFPQSEAEGLEGQEREGGQDEAGKGGQ